MKQLLLFLSVIACLNLSVFAGDAKHFEYDEAGFDAAFVELNDLEQSISENPDQDFEMISKSVPNLMTPNDFTRTYGPIGIPGFWWGCFLGPVGMLIVAISHESGGNDFTNSIIGCIVGSLVWGGGWLLWGPAF